MTKPKSHVPIRGRGRPKGSKNKPKNIKEFVATHIGDPLNAPTMPGLNFATLKPEDRSEWGRFLAAVRDAKKTMGTSRGPGPMRGTYRGTTHGETQFIKAAAALDAKRMFDIMDKQGLLPDDELARVGLLTALQVLREPNQTRDKLTAARLLLDFTKQKPATKNDVTINAAEAFLAALHEDDGSSA